jgi:hypothetical protein
VQHLAAARGRTRQAVAAVPLHSDRAAGGAAARPCLKTAGHGTDAWVALDGPDSAIWGTPARGSIAQAMIALTIAQEGAQRAVHARRALNRRGRHCCLGLWPGRQQPLHGWCILLGGGLLLGGELGVVGCRLEKGAKHGGRQHGGAEQEEQQPHVPRVQRGLHRGGRARAGRPGRPHRLSSSTSWSRSIDPRWLLSYELGCFSLPYVQRPGPKAPHRDCDHRDLDRAPCG